MAKLETVIKEVIARGARRTVRVLVLPLRREVLRLRRKVGELQSTVTTLSRSAAGRRRLMEAAPRSPMCPRRGEGRAALASVSPDKETAWSEPDGVGAADGCECASRGPLGGGRIDADWQEPPQLSGFTEGWKARGEGVARAPG